MHSDEKHTDRLPSVSIKASEAITSAKDEECCGIEDQADEAHGRRDQDKSYHLPSSVAINIMQKLIERQTQTDEDHDAKCFGKHAPTKERFVPE